MSSDVPQKEGTPSHLHCTKCGEELSVEEVIHSLGLPHPCDPPWTRWSVAEQAKREDGSWTPLYCYADQESLERQLGDEAA